MLKNLRQQVTSQLTEATGGLGTVGVPAPPVQTFPAPGSPLPTTPPPAERHPDRASLVHPQELGGLLRPQPEHIQQSATFVFSSPFIQCNAQYQHRVGQISFLFMGDDAELNAFATDAEFKLPDGRSVKPPLIVFLGGLANAIRLASTALAAYIRSVRGHLGAISLPHTFRQMGRAVIETGGFPFDASVAVFREHILPSIVDGEDRFVSLARSYAAAMDMFVIAHEAGHLALGHTLGRRLNYDISRNQEREADSFASSTLSTSPFREYLFLGQVFTTVIFAWVERTAAQREAGTHPLGRERFYNAIESNSDAAREAADEFGLTRDGLLELLPPEDQRFG
jgi:hypothetical protein